MRIYLPVLFVAALTGAGQTPPAKSVAKSPANQKGVESSSDYVRMLAGVKISKDAKGVWKCLHANGKPCSGPEVEAVTTVTKSRSNVKDNLLTVAPDGTLKCMNTATGKVCTDTEIEAVTQHYDLKSNGKL